VIGQRVTTEAFSERCGVGQIDARPRDVRQLFDATDATAALEIRQQTILSRVGTDDR
jgi:hypothetical protein